MSRFTKFTQIWLVVATLFLFLGAGDNSARFSFLGHQVMCVCGCNYVLLECNHVGCPNSDRMRAELIAAVDSGKNDSAVLQGFVEKYGPVVLLAPPKTGFGSIAWITPYAALVLGIMAMIFVVRILNKKITKPALPGGDTYSHELDSYRDQVRRDTEI